MVYVTLVLYMCYIKPTIMVNVRCNSCFLEHGYKHPLVTFQRIWLFFTMCLDLCFAISYFLCVSLVTCMFKMASQGKVKQLEQVKTKQPE